MTVLLPLQAMIARAEGIGEIVAPQLDSLARGGRHQYAVDRPDSFLNVVLSRDDFGTENLPDMDIAKRASDHFEAMVGRGLFTGHETEAMFMYELSTPSHTQLGLMAGVPMSAVEEGRIRGHEGTIREKAEDLANFYRTSRLNSSPVSLAFGADEDQRQLFQHLSAGEPIREFTGWDEVRQRLWVVDDPADLATVQSVIARVEHFYITDGHHRVAASQFEGAVPGWFLGVLYPAEQMHVLEYNRCVHLDAHPTSASVLASLPSQWQAESLGVAADPRPSRRGEVSMLIDGDWHRLTFTGQRPDDVVRSLDVCLLHEQILGPVFGVDDDHDRRLSFVVGEEAYGRLEEVVRSEPNTVAFALHPTSIDELFDVADAGRTMPAKSTWFTPKPRSGLVVVRW